MAYSYGDSTSKPTIAVYDLALKSEVSVNAFASLPTLLDFDEGSVVASFGDFKVKTIRWDTVSDETVRVNTKFSNFASQAHNLLGFFNKDPFNGGCQVLAHLDDPTHVLWTNCDERIEAVSPDGKRVATIALLSDGIGPADVMVRKIGGAPVVHYSISGCFGRIWWETGDQAADGGQRQDPGRHRAVQGRRLQPGQRPRLRRRTSERSVQPVRAARRAARTIGACSGNRA